MGSALDILMRDLNSSTKLEGLWIDVIKTNVTNATVHPLAGLPLQTLQLLWVPLPTNYWIEKPVFASITSLRKLITDFLALPAWGSLNSPLQTLVLLSFLQKFPYVIHNTTLQRITHRSSVIATKCKSD